MKIEFIKDLYTDTWTSRDRLAADLGTPIGLVTLLGGILGYYGTGYDFRWGITTCVFVLLLSLGLLGVIATSVYIFLAFHGYTYWSLPLPARWFVKKRFSARTTLLMRMARTPPRERSTNTSRGDSWKEPLATQRNNGSRSAYLHPARRRLSATAIVRAVCSLPWVINHALAHTHHRSSDRPAS